MQSERTRAVRRGRDGVASSVIGVGIVGGRGRGHRRRLMSPAGGAELEHGQPGDGEEHEVGDRRGVAVVAEAELVVGVEGDRQRRVERTALGHHEGSSKTWIRPMLAITVENSRVGRSIGSVT